MVPDLLKVIAKLDDRRGLEHPVRVDDQLAVLKRVNVTLDEEQIRARLDRQEPRARDVDPVAVLEVLDRGSGCRLELCNVKIKNLSK
jgi:hypothetical protein